MAGRVGHDERTRGRGEIAVSDIDRDALLALGLKSVDQQGEIDLLAQSAVPQRVAAQSGKLIVEDQLTFIEKAPDERRLAVVDRSAGQDPQSGSRPAWLSF